MCAGIRMQQQRDAEPDQDGLGEQEPEKVPERIRIAVLALPPRIMICRPALRIGCEKSNSISRAAVIEIAATPISAFFDRTSSSNARTSGASW